MPLTLYPIIPSEYHATPHEPHRFHRLLLPQRPWVLLIVSPHRFHTCRPWAYRPIFLAVLRDLKHIETTLPAPCRLSVDMAEHVSTCNGISRSVRTSLSCHVPLVLPPSAHTRARRIGPRVVTTDVVPSIVDLRRGRRVSAPVNGAVRASACY